MRRWALAAALALATLAVYAPVLEFEFVNYDDPGYVTANPRVLGGLSLSGSVWAFSGVHSGNWHPLTSLSHQADVSLFGLDAGAHHATNLLLHVINTLLLFWLIVRTTGRDWPAALVAALFALHPLHVESVAWVAERKDVLSTAFGFGALLAYVEYAQRGGARRYVLVALLFGLSLLSKPMLVTLPILMLLLDLWPLGRWSLAAPDRGPLLLRLLREKLPLLALSLAVAAVTLAVQASAGATELNAAVPLFLRLCNAAVAAVSYLGLALWPVSLGPMVPHPYYPGGTPLGVGQVVLSCIALAAISALALRACVRGRPAVLAGWLWYLVALLPVIGIVQVGSQGLADRYTYVPLVGPFWIVAFLGADWLQGKARAMRVLAGAAAAVALLALALTARQQVGIWRDSLTLMQHVVDVVGGTPKSLNQLGTALEATGRSREAAARYREALALDATFAGAHNNLANLLVGSGRFPEAVVHYRAALQQDPELADAHSNLAAVMLELQRPRIAVQHLREAVRIAPEVADFHVNLGIALVAVGDNAGARAELQRGLVMAPGHATAVQWLRRLDRGRGVPPKSR